jgi:hypothetical protein
MNLVDRLLRRGRKASGRRIGHLAIVAGVSASGKSSLLDRLRDDPDLRARLDLPEEPPMVVTAMDLAGLPRTFIPTLVVHYDLMRLIRHDLRAYRDDPALEILREADTLQSIVLAQSPDVLRERLHARFPDPVARERYQWFAEPGFVAGRYMGWFEYWDAVDPGLRHYCVRSDEHYSMFDDRAALLRIVGA